MNYKTLNTSNASIHFPREGEDGDASDDGDAINKLQSTSPARGKTFAKPFIMVDDTTLQSTSPARGKTAKNTTNSMKVLFVFVYYFYFIQISRNSILLFVYLLYKYTIYFWCESLWNTMCTSGSHYA